MKAFTKPIGDDEKAFDGEVLEFECPTCHSMPSIPCRSKHTGMPVRGDFAQKFHRSRVQLAGYLKR